MSFIIVKQWGIDIKGVYITMYAVLTTLSLPSGMWKVACESSDKSLALFKTMKGFKQATFFGDSDSGKYNCSAVWDSKANVDAAYAKLGPMLTEAMKALNITMKAPTVRQVYELYEAKG
jgi:hypothetical protein